jgi:predicted ATPase/class 3 adenylate cyclase
MTEIEQLERAITALEAQRALLGDTVVDAARSGLVKRLAALRAPLASTNQTATSEPGERKLVTVMFADISGFTALSEKLDPEGVRNVINACFEGLVPVIEKYGGTVDKFIGDEIMALFGAPVANENDPERALRAALEMQEALDRFNAENAGDLGLHFGINTGVVLAGDIGSRGRRQYSVMGDAVNLASRLGDASERGEIFVGPDTYRLTSGLFEFKALAPLSLKGKAEPVPVWRLLGPRRRPASRRGIEGLCSPLVGREKEVGVMQSALEALRAGKGGTIALQAEAGLGKSRLVAEARHGVAEGLTWVEGRCLSYTEGSSYWVARDVFRGLLGVKPEISPAEVIAALHGGVTRLCGERFGEIYPLLGRFLEVRLEKEFEQQIADLPAEVLRQRMVEAYREFVRLHTLQGPMVLVWEDLHWADPSSLSLLEQLLPLTSDHPLLVLLVFRPEEGPTLTWHCQRQAKLGPLYQTLELVPLSHAESAQLAGSLLRIENLPGETRDLILRKAEGNPFFLEELLRSLIDAGFVALGAEGAVAVKPVSDLDVPDTLQGVIASRIDHLPAEHKRALQTASVIGRVFQQRVLGLLLERESVKLELEETLTSLRRREFVRLRIPGAAGFKDSAWDDEYIFKHVLTQVVTYNSLLLARRKSLHRLAGEAIEALFPEALDELSATLAYHFERAEDRDKAIHYLTRAAIRAKAIYANAEAISFYRTALAQVYSLLEHGGADRDAWQQRAAYLNEDLGEVLALVAKYDEALASHQEVLERVSKQDVICRSRIFRKIARIHQTQRRYEESLRALQEADIALGEARTPSSSQGWQEWIEIQVDRMYAHYWLGEVTEMAELAEKAKPILQQYGEVLQQRKFLRGMVLLGLRRDCYVVTDETLAYARALFAVLEQSEDDAEVALDRFLVGFTHLWRGDLTESEAHLQAALRLAERTGNVEVQSRCLTYLTVLFRKRGQVDETQIFSERSIVVAKAGRMIEYISMAQANQAWVAWRRGDPAEAKNKAEESFAVFEKVAQGRMFRWTALWPLLGVALARNSDQEAVQHAQALLDPRDQAPPPALASLLNEAVQSWEAGRPEPTRATLQRAVELATTLGYL